MKDWIAAFAFLLGGFTILAACDADEHEPTVNDEERSVEACIAEGGVPSFTQTANGLYVERYLGCTKVQADA